MMIVQRMLHPSAKKFNVTAKVGEVELGYAVGSLLNVYQKGDTLLFTHEEPPVGFGYVKEAKVFSSQGRAQAQLFQPWVKANMEGLKFLRVYYTSIGIFVKPFRKGDLSGIIQ